VTVTDAHNKQEKASPSMHSDSKAILANQDTSLSSHTSCSDDVEPYGDVDDVEPHGDIDDTVNGGVLANFFWLTVY